MIKAIVAFILFLGVVSTYADTTPKYNLLKNHLQFGLTSINFKDGYGFLANDNRGIISLRYSRLSFNYERFLRNRYSVGINYTFFTQRGYYKTRNQTSVNDSKHGDLLYRFVAFSIINVSKYFDVISLGNAKIFFKTSLLGGRRWGADHIFLGAFPGGFDYASTRVQSKGFGLGAGSEIGVIAYKHFSLSASLNFMHVFEKGKFEEQSPPFAEYYKYTPPKNMFVFQPKIGFLF